MTEDEMVGWHQQLNGHEFEQTLGVGDGQGGLAGCRPWGCRVDTTEQLNNNKRSPEKPDLPRVPPLLHAAASSSKHP